MATSKGMGFYLQYSKKKSNSKNQIAKYNSKIKGFSTKNNQKSFIIHCA